MTDAEQILADIILLKVEPKTPFRMERYLHNVTIGLPDTQPEQIYKEICDITISRSSVIEDFLRTQGYIKFTDISTHQYILTDEGEEAQRQGGHQQYLTWLKSEKKKKGFEDFPKKKWHIYEPLKWILFLLAGIAIERYLLKGCGQDKYQEKEKANEQSTSQKLPNNSDSVNGLYGQDSNLHQDKLVSENNDSTKY